jgi:glycosyltransferase involved in cell wall biosynthesis
MNNRNIILFDIREISGKPAGVGRIITSLIKAMQSIEPQKEFVLVGDVPAMPIDIKGKYINLGSSNLLWHIKCARLIKNSPEGGTYISVRSPLVPIMVPEKSVFFVNDLISFRYPEYFTLKTRVMETIFTRMALRRVGRIIAISYSTARDIESLCPGAALRTKVVHLAGDSVFRKRLPNSGILNKYGLPGKYILTVGTVEPRKNHLALLDAYEMLPGAIRDQYGLVIAGKRGWKCEKIIKRIKQAEAAGRVRYLEYLCDEDLAQVYSGASLFVYPSVYEGFGLPVLEAMNCGAPVIASDNSSLPEVGGDAACYVKHDNYGQLARAMESILTDPKLAEEMSQKGLVQGRKFSWGKTALEIYGCVDNI